MITFAGWAIFLLLLSVLAWRALGDGRAHWGAIGGLGLAVFGAHLWGAAQEIFRLVAAEQWTAPAPRLDWLIVVFAALLFLRQRKRT
jgi:hypothetical protein